jgi:ribosomal protein S14
MPKDHEKETSSPDESVQPIPLPLSDGGTNDPTLQHAAKCDACGHVAVVRIDEFYLCQNCLEGKLPEPG